MSFHIRHIEPSDSKDLHDIYSNPSVLANTSQVLHLSAEHVHKLIMGQNRYTLVAESEEKVLGYVALYLNQKPRQKHTAGLAIAIHSDAQGKGVGKRLMQEVVHHADHWLNLVRLELEVHSDNEAALSLYHSMGFEREGEKQLATFKSL